jgi:hypothetical protein
MQPTYQELLDELQRIRIELYHANARLEQSMAVTNYERIENRKLKNQIDKLCKGTIDGDH